MDIGLDKSATPYPPEQARNLFRDLLLGIEYRTSFVSVAANHINSTCPGYCPS